MSLVSESMEECVMLDKTHAPDGEGGFTSTWVDGAGFNAAITFDSSIQAKIAEKRGVTSLYTVTTDINTKLKFHDVFRRVSDSKVFRVTSDGDDKTTPHRSSFQFSQVTAEEWALE